MSGIVGIMIAVAIGFILGKYVAVWLLTAVTVIVVGHVLYAFKKFKEFTKLIAIIEAAYVGIVLAVMWITYYLTSGQSFLSNIVNTYILR